MLIIPDSQPGHNDVILNANYTMSDGMQNLKEQVNVETHLIDELPDVASLIQKSAVRSSPAR